MDAWASFAESDQPAEDAPHEAEDDQSEAKVEDLAVGRLRLWLRGVFGGGGSARD